MAELPVTSAAQAKEKAGRTIPTEVLRQAFREGWYDDPKAWQDWAKGETPSKPQ